MPCQRCLLGRFVFCLSNPTNFFLTRYFYLYSVTLYMNSKLTRYFWVGLLT